jgi:thymidine phosphorylase
MLAQEIIRRKRDGETLSADEIAAFVAGLTSGEVTEGQAAALAMAVVFRPLSGPERVALTEAMRDSGEVLSWDLPGPVVDKHSTGGVGDNVSLMLAPALAACGAYVPMISGRGLGHTGGTLDKLSAIPGYDVAPGAEALRRVVGEVGCAVIGQTEALAPADRRLYAIRDVTATVESVDLITASILSKKLAEGLDALVLDVKAGSGAFMASESEARGLARALVEAATGAGCPCSALITDMDEPLASACGNAVEVANAVRFLTGAEVDPRLWDVTVALGGELLALAGLAPDAGAGAARIGAAFESGRAAERFGRMVAALGGPADFVERFEAHLPQAPVILDVPPERDGLLAGMDARALGLAVVELGGGRRRAQDDVDPAVGLSQVAGIGALVDADFPLARIHARDRDAAERAAERVRAACRVGEDAPEPREPVLGRVGPGDP